MRRRKVTKTQRPNTLRRRNGPKVAPHRKPLVADANERIALLTRERDEALERQTATSEVLKVISSSPGELEPVFNAMLESAVRLCEAKLGTLFLSEGKDNYRTAALYGAPPAFAEARWKNPVIKASPGAGLSRVAATKEPVQILDIRNDPAYTRDPSRAAILELAGARTVLNVPMLKDNELVGQIVIYRQEVRSFTDKQIELVKNFAAQAVIAIENTRLLNELRQRTEDLSESLEQQTATSEVLRIISSSPGDLEPVFEAMLQNSIRICEAGFGQMFLCEGDNVRLVAAVGVPTVLVEFDKQRGAFQPSPGGGLDGVMRTKQVVHIADLLSEHASYPPTRLGGARSYIAVPMLKENKLVGAIAIYRQEVQPFTNKQIELVKNFAAQAVIAIENTRLLSELRESLQQQTATADVLKIISSSPGNLEPVFEAILENATRMCEAKFGVLFTYRDGLFHNAATRNVPQALLEFYRQRGSFEPPSGSVLNRF